MDDVVGGIEDQVGIGAVGVLRETELRTRRPIGDGPIGMMHEPPEERREIVDDLHVVQHPRPVVSVISYHKSSLKSLLRVKGSRHC